MIVFNTIAISKAIATEGKILATCAAKVQEACEKTNVEFAKVVDGLTLAWADTKLTKAQFWGKPSGEVRMAIKGIVAQGETLGAWQSDMSETMVHCVGVAFQANVPFTRNLKKTHKADGTPRVEKREAADGAATSGGVTTTTPEAAEKTARKLIGQLRMLGNDSVASGIVDAMLEFNPAFTETEPAKA
jgi:hypothetical protein